MKKQKVAVIGAGISGLTVAQLLKDKYHVTVYEKDDKPGGLIKCDRINGSLFHTCGGQFEVSGCDRMDKAICGL